MRRLSVSLMVATGLGLSGCAGDGVATGSGFGDDLAMQTLVGIAMVGSPRDDDPNINYAPRPGLVLPGNANQLPAPVQTTNAAGNWPNDPDGNRVNVLAPERERRSLGQVLATRPQSPLLTDDESDEVILNRLRQERRDGRGGTTVPNAQQLVEADGTPRRRFLTDPPVEIRQPAAGAGGTVEVGQVGVPQQKRPFLRRILPF